MKLTQSNIVRRYAIVLGALVVLASATGAIMVTIVPQPLVTCGTTLTTPLFPKKIKLTLADPIVDATNPCIGTGLIIGSDNITLDCDGFTITGDTTGVGILLNGVDNVTVINCTVTNFAAGIVLNGSSDNTLEDNTATDNKSAGSGGFALLNSSNRNTLMWNEATGNTGRGFICNQSSNNTLNENVANLNLFRGFDCTVSSNGNTLTKNTATNNLSAGFVCSIGSTGNKFMGNESSFSEFEGFAIFSSGNTLRKNEANNNGTYGYRDTTSGSGLAGTANTYPPLTIGKKNMNNPNRNRCTGNGTAGSLPTGLCN